MKVYNTGSRSIAPLILTLGTRCRWVVSIMPRPLYPQERIPLNSPRAGLMLPLTVTERRSVQPVAQSLHRLLYFVFTNTEIPSKYINVVIYLVHFTTPAYLRPQAHSVDDRMTGRLTMINQNGFGRNRQLHNWAATPGGTEKTTEDNRQDISCFGRD